MKAIIRVLCIVFTFSMTASNSYAAPDCARLESAREQAWQQLRRSHGAAQANRLHARVRQLNEQIAAYCH